MKLSANESLHCPGSEMVSNRKFSVDLPPTEAPKVRVMTSSEKMRPVKSH